MNYGRGDLMAISAFRYCLGRQTYIVSDCVDWLCQVWGDLEPNAQRVIRRDLDDAFKRDDEDRLDGRAYKALGHDCDRSEWERLKEHINA